MAVEGNCGGQDDIWKTKSNLRENRLLAGQRAESKLPFDSKKSDHLANSGVVVVHYSKVQYLQKRTFMGESVGKKCTVS